MMDFYATVANVEAIGGNYFLLNLDISPGLGEVIPGQFVMVRIDSKETFLRRPFSIFSYSENSLSILFKVRGRGTEALTKMKKGQELRVLGPLGNGFSIERKEHYVVIAGGIGVAGVNLLLEKLGGDANFYLGISKSSDLPLIKMFLKFDPKVSTLDGSYGYKGDVVSLFVTDLHKFILSDFLVYACGPNEMYKSLKDALSEMKTPCQILLEERMACGLGLCYGCVVKTHDENDPYKRVCFEGPRFSLWEISL